MEVNNLNAAILDATSDFLNFYDPKSPIDPSSVFEFNRVPIKDILNFLAELDLVNSNNSINLDSLKSNSMTYVQTIMLNFMKSYNPSWLIRFQDGIESLKSLESDDQNLAIYEALRLTDIFSTNLEEEALNFFDAAQVLAFSDDNEEAINKLKTGRKGEKYSCQLEKSNSPESEIIKHFILNSKRPYDIEMVFPKRKRFIEVKSSSLEINSAIANISYSQVEAAKDSIDSEEEYLFHFWSFHNGKNYLAKIEAQEIHDKWHQETMPGIRLPEQQVKFSLFADKFNEEDIQL